MKVWIILFLIRILGGPTEDALLEGNVTWYGCPPFCGKMANGEPFGSDLPACAVDCGLFPEMVGMCLLIVPDAKMGTPVFVEVADCGYLERWTGDWDVPVVIDLPEATFQRAAPPGPWGKAGIFEAKVYEVADRYCEWGW